MIEDTGWLFADFATTGLKPIAKRRVRRVSSVISMTDLARTESGPKVPIMGIDPGTNQSAYVVWDGTRVQLFAIEENYAMLEVISKKEGDWDLAIEMVQSFGMPVGRDIFTTVLWVGRFFQRYCDRFPSKSVDLVYRGEVKKFFCGNMKAKDGNIRQALIDMVGPQGNKKSPGPTYGIAGDLWQALAVAVFSANATPF